MDITFSLKRVGYIIHADWIEYRKNILYYSLTIFGCCFFLKYIYDWSPGGLYFWMIFFIFMIFCFYVNQKVFQAKKMFLSLPANTKEKLVSLLLEGTFLLLVNTVIFGLFVGVSKVITGEWIVKWEYIRGIHLESIVYICFLLTLLLLLFVVFKKYIATTITVAGIFFTMFLLSFNSKHIEAKIRLGEGINIREFYLGPFSNLESYYYLIMCMLMAIVLSLAYYKLKKKQIR